MAGAAAGAAMAKRAPGGNGTDAAQPVGGSRPASPADEGVDLKGRLEQFGDLLGRGLDLAEAGLSLGITLATTLGTVAQQKIVGKIMDVAGSDPSPQASVSGAAPAPASPAPPPQAFGITNRLPLVPGMAVSISFSINNDSAVAPKQVSLRVEPFTGERSGAMLPPESLLVTPASIAIAPMDFEKFVLVGAIPEMSPPDTYNGSIAVTAEDSMRIPVLLVVEG
jgi:hypothetical protein